MTKKEFKSAMLRGLGRCVMGVQQQPEKYRDIVLWGCKRNIAYDVQSEGSRAWYIYTMANEYPDKEPFIQAAAEALKIYRPNGSWDLLHLSELLSYFDRDGHQAAAQAIQDKYVEILAGMHARKRRPNRIFHELSDLEQLGLVLAADRTSFLRVAADFGRLYHEKSYMRDGDFDSFFSVCSRRYRKSMEHAAKMNENIACFMLREQAYIDASTHKRQAQKEESIESLSGIRLSRYLKLHADRETINQYITAYKREIDPQKRTKALDAFLSCPYPDDPQPLIEDTKSGCKQLQSAAWRVLEDLRHPTVRSFALSNSAKGIHTLENFSLLIANYHPEDKDHLESLLYSFIDTEDRDDIHSAGLSILAAFRKNSGIPHPKHLLPILYNYTPCSFCRESAVVYMSKHRLLTIEILEECLYDCNDDIRRFAAKRLCKL